MTTEQVIEAVKSNRLQPGWAVFRYNYKYAVSRIAGRLFFPILFLPAAAVFLMNLAVNKDTFLILSVFLVTFSLVSLLTLIPVIIELFYSKNSFIVFSDDGIIKCFKGRTEFFPYNCIINVKFTNPGGNSPAIARRKEQYIDFRDNRSNKFINLAKNRIFGFPESIYEILINKLPMENKISNSQSFSSNHDFFKN